MLLKTLFLVCGISTFVAATTRYNRATGFFPSFDEASNVPQDEYIETSPGDDAFGGSYDIAFSDLTGVSANIFGTDITHFRCFDVGYCECGTAQITNTITGASDLPTADSATGTALTANKCLIAPFVMGLDESKYHMAVRVVQSNLPQNKHDTERITAEVNTAKHQFHTTWVASKAIIATWKIESGGGVNKFQAIVAVGDLSDGGQETFVLFVYEDALPLTGYGIQGFVNGLYTDGNEKFARVCSEVGATNPSTPATPAVLTANSNYKCGNPGIYVLPVSVAGDTCVADTACGTGTPVTNNQNCNQTSVPQDTCTESFSCKVTPGNVVRLTLNLQWYTWPRIQALDYAKYIANEEQEFAVGLVFGEDRCGKTFSPYNTVDSIGEFILDVPMATFTFCGTILDTNVKSLKFAFKIYDGQTTSQMVDQNGDVIIYGECFYDELATAATQTPRFKDPEVPTSMPPRSRVLSLKVIDRPDADGFYEITTAEVGRDLYLLVTFEPGQPWNLWADPYGVYVVDCWASNNNLFVHDTATWERSQKFIDNGCPVDKVSGGLEAIWLTKSFAADPDHAPDTPDGTAWYLVTGVTQAAKWTKLNAGNTAPVNEIFFKCSVGFGTLGNDHAKCVDNCDSDRRKRSVNYDSNMETIYTRVSLTTGADNQPQGTGAEDCVNRTNLTTAFTTIGVLLALLVVAVVVCILMMLKWFAVKKAVQKRHSMKKAAM